MEPLSINHPRVRRADFPTAAMLAYPERVLQFGTGVLLRGLTDYAIETANRRALFQGRIVVVKSTDGGDAGAFDRQDGLYTLCIRGIRDGLPVAEDLLCSPISRVLAARTQWADILQAATQPAIEVVISNTTEVGLQYVPEDIRATPPASFPAKLLACLYARYQAVAGDPARGWVIIPTELIPDNGTRLADMLLRLAHHNALDASFIHWLTTANTCCNSLVDRIVPGSPDEGFRAGAEAALGYQDDLMILAEPYRLWAIEGGEQVRARLAFAATDAGVIIAPDITRYRELKLRLLNAVHTLTCGLAHLAGFETVSAGMESPALSGFVSDLMVQEIGQALPPDITQEDMVLFAHQVLDRFRNPYIRHRWLAITLQYTAKVRMRVLPVLRTYITRFGQPPAAMALGMAAYIRCMRVTGRDAAGYWGEANGNRYQIQDDHAAWWETVWQTDDPELLVRQVLRQTDIWGEDLTLLPGWEAAVLHALRRILDQGAGVVLGV